MVASVSHTSASAEKLLVADDDPTTRFAICGMLKKAGYRVTAAKDGAEALRKIERSHFELAFLDAAVDRTRSPCPGSCRRITPEDCHHDLRRHARDLAAGDTGTGL